MRVSEGATSQIIWKYIQALPQMAFSFGQIGSLAAVSQLVYGRIAVAIRPYGKWNTVVRQLRYGDETWSLGLPNGLTTMGMLYGERNEGQRGSSDPNDWSQWSISLRASDSFSGMVGRCLR